MATLWIRRGARTGLGLRKSRALSISILAPDYAVLGENGKIDAAFTPQHGIELEHTMPRAGTIDLGIRVAGYSSHGRGPDVKTIVHPAFGVSKDLLLNDGGVVNQKTEVGAGNSTQRRLM